MDPRRSDEPDPLHALRFTRHALRLTLHARASRPRPRPAPRARNPWPLGRRPRSGESRRELGYVVVDVDVRRKLGAVVALLVRIVG